MHTCTLLPVVHVTATLEENKQDKVETKTKTTTTTTTGVPALSLFALISDKVMSKGCMQAPLTSHTAFI